MRNCWAFIPFVAGFATAQWETAYTATAPAAVAKAAATALTLSPTSNVKGKAFDRFVVVWLENTDYDKAVGDRKHYLFSYLHPTNSRASELGLPGKERNNIVQLFRPYSPKRAKLFVFYWWRLFRA